MSNQNLRVCSLILFLLLAVSLHLTACHTPFGIYHTVKKGETLYAIGNTYGISVGKLKNVNYLRDASNIHPGDQIFIPGAGKVKKVGKYKGQSKKSKQKKYAKAGKSKSKQKKITKTGNIPLHKLKLIWPLEGVLTSKYGPRNGGFHTGIDIAAPKGTPVMAASYGRVIYSDNKMRGFGNMVIIKHDSGFFTLYAHLSVFLVHDGDRVKRGEVIGRVGSTGRSTGPHLHFEVRYHKKSLNPMKLLP